MGDRYIVRYMSGNVEEVEVHIFPKPDKFEGLWEVWLLDYKPQVKEPVRVSKQMINLETVEKIQDVKC